MGPTEAQVAALAEKLQAVLPDETKREAMAFFQMLNDRLEATNERLVGLTDRIKTENAKFRDRLAS